jgi:hypothetical protein
MLPAELISGSMQSLGATVPALLRYILLAPYSIMGHVALAWSASSHFPSKRTLWREHRGDVHVELPAYDHLSLSKNRRGSSRTPLSHDSNSCSKTLCLSNMLLSRSRQRTTLGVVFVSFGCIIFFLSKIFTFSTAVNSLSTHVSNPELLRTGSLSTEQGSKFPSTDDDDGDGADMETEYTRVEGNDQSLASIYAEDFHADENDLEAEMPMVDKSESHDINDDENNSSFRNDQDDEDEDSYDPLPDGIDYREIFSLSTADRKFIPIFTGGVNIYNPNIMPHPTDHDLWIIVAQHEQRSEEHKVEQLTCDGGVMNGVMVCTAEPVILPIEPSITGQCEGDLAYFNFRDGPRDARMFHGPDAPYIVYGSQSSYTCLGIWLEDVRMLLQHFQHEKDVLPKLFTHATEIQRPPPVKGIEKNFFLFWDREGKAYVHHDVYPHRVFAQISFDGSVGPNLALASANKDDMCLSTYMPTLAPTEESIHQASNSLAITLCRRKDPGCIPDATNTFVFTIFQHKSYHDWHGMYEPYVMLFQQDAPFAIHAISQRPLWIHGRAPLTKDTHSPLYDDDPGKEIPNGHTEMFYVTSISWKTHGQKYHGYLDDPLFLGFGIEDHRAGIMDISAEDLFQDLGYCV